MDIQKKLLKSLAVNIPFRVLDAQRLCLEAHRDQTRKRGNIPYSVHPLRVYTFIREVIGVDDEAVLCGALLHDVVEDTPCSLKQIEEQFGARIAKVVEELTIPDDITRKEKGTALITMGKEMSNRSRIIKAVDRLDNLSDMLDSFSDGGKRFYTIEAIKLHKALTMGLVVDEFHKHAVLALGQLSAMIKAVIAEGRERSIVGFHEIRM